MFRQVTGDCRIFDSRRTWLGWKLVPIPLLVERGSSDRVDRILVVVLDRAVQLQRVMASDGCTLEQARAIAASQASRSARLAVVADVLLNTGTVTDLRQAVDRLSEGYLRLTEIQRPEGDLAQT